MHTKRIVQRHRFRFVHYLLLKSSLKGKSNAKVVGLNFAFALLDFILYYYIIEYLNNAFCTREIMSRF